MMNKSLTDPDKYDFNTDTSYVYGSVDLKAEKQYLRKYSVYGSLLLLFVDTFILFLPWTITASIVFELRAVFVWIIMLPFLIRIPLLLISLFQVTFPHKVGSALDMSYKESRKYINLRLLGVPGPYSSLRRYGYIAKLLHPTIIILTLIVQGTVLVIWGSSLVFYLNAGIGAIIVIVSWVMTRILMVEFYSKPLTIAVNRQMERKRTNK